VTILVIDVGTSSVRATVVDDEGRTRPPIAVATPPARPSPGVVEFDPVSLAGAVLGAAGRAIRQYGPVSGVGIAAQRASTVLWDRRSGEPVGPGIGWQDLRTTGQCLALRQKGLRLAPNQSATKLLYLLDVADPERRRDLCFGTIESWLAWRLSEGSAHVTDATNAAVTGLVRGDASDWDDDVLDLLRIPRSLLPTIVDSTGVAGIASSLDGTPPIAGLIGDQQASLIGQGCIHAGETKATFGTGGMLDCCLGARRPAAETRGEAGTFPIVAWREAGQITWGIEAIMLSAGSCVDWLRDGIGLLSTAAESDALAASVSDTGGVSFVPALGGIGTPLWDFGARGALVGLGASTSRAEIVRAVLEGIAHRGADLLEAVESDSGLAVAQLRLDGGMSTNRCFVQLLANATRRPVARASVTEATTLGAAFLTGRALGTWSGLEDAVATTAEPEVVEPGRHLDRERWLDARQRALRTVPFLSSLEF